MPDTEPGKQPANPTAPDIDPDHRAAPGFTPNTTPGFTPDRGSEFERGVSPPEILPDSAPDATPPPQPPGEIPSPAIG